MRKKLPSSDKKPPAQRSAVAELDQSIGFLIADTARFVKRSLYIRIGQHGIRGGSWLFLRALWRMDGVTQRELSNQLGLMEPSVLEMLRVMERDGLISRKRDEADRRKVRVYLTPAARKLEARLMKIAEDNNTMMLGRISRSDEAKLRTLLHKIRQTLSEELAALTADQAEGTPLARSKVEETVPKIGSAGRPRSRRAAAPRRAAKAGA